jgi:hypothetical protein
MEIFATILAGWFVFGPSIWIGISSKVTGRRKAVWIASALAPIPLAIAGVAIFVAMYPEFSFNVHSSHFAFGLCAAVLGAWTVMLAYMTNRSTQ